MCTPISEQVSELTRREKQGRERELLLAPVGTREGKGTGVQEPILQQLPFTEDEVTPSYSTASLCFQARLGSSRCLQHKCPTSQGHQPLGRSAGDKWMRGELQKTLTWVGVSHAPAPLAHPCVLSWAKLMFNKASEGLPPRRSLPG